MGDKEAWKPSERAAERSLLQTGNRQERQAGGRKRREEWEMLLLGRIDVVLTPRASHVLYRTGNQATSTAPLSATAAAHFFRGGPLTSPRVWSMRAVGLQTLSLSGMGILGSVAGYGRWKYWLLAPGRRPGRLIQ